MDFERLPDPGNQSLNLTQTNNKRNNGIKAHVFHIPLHSERIICILWGRALT